MGNGEPRGSLVFVKNHCHTPSTPSRLPPGVGPHRLSPFLVSLLSCLPCTHLTSISSDRADPAPALKLGESRSTLTFLPLPLPLTSFPSLVYIKYKKASAAGTWENHHPGARDRGGTGGGQEEEPQPGTLDGWGPAQPSSLGRWQRRLHLPLRHHVHGVPGWGLQAGQKSRNSAL